MPQTPADLVRLFDLTPTGELSFRGPHPETKLQRLFGGQVLSQTLRAAQRTVPDDRACHSLNAYFLRPGSNESPLDFHVEVLRDGRSFSSRRVSTVQDGTLIFQLNASFHIPEEGLEHSAEQPVDVLSPDQAPIMKDLLTRQLGTTPAMLEEWDALDVRVATPPGVGPDGGHQRIWVRTTGPVDDEPGLHTAILAYLSDMPLLSVATAAHKANLFELQFSSIDHAMWFHRPARVDEWMLYDMTSPSASGARGFCQGRLFQDGSAIASCAQEGLIRLG